ncbi:MAG: hypothetical protein OXP75_02840 [Rhodospirillales bacterium]|nr:hypothetical protein [Rhodospirillales bacterium]
MAADGTWAGGELLAPFPGAATDGGGRTAQVAPEPLGATAASPVAPAAPVTAAEETARPAENPAEPVTGPAAIGKPAGNGTAQDRARNTQADVPAGGSRLLRALAGTEKAPASQNDGTAGAASRSGTSVFAAEGCPRALLWRLLAGAAGEADALSALGIEREILALCRERQEILVGLFEAEAALRELSAPPPAAEPVARTSKPVAPAPATQTIAASRAATPSPLRAALVAAENSDEAGPKALARVSPARVSPRYAWFSIIGTAGALRAGITDGSGVWFVREGDALPGGARIAAIAGRPPAVRVTGAGEAFGPETLVPESGEATALPYRARPGDAP